MMGYSATLGSLFVLLWLTAIAAAESPCSTLKFAAFTGETAAIERLVGQGTSVECKEKENTPLMSAVMGMQPEAVRALLRLGADVNARDNNGSTALSIVEDVPWFWAFMFEASEAEINRTQDQIVRLLLRAGGTR